MDILQLVDMVTFFVEAVSPCCHLRIHVGDLLLVLYFEELLALIDFHRQLFHGQDFDAFFLQIVLKLLNDIMACEVNGWGWSLYLSDFCWP